jgi:uncharacterized protein (DUF1501 family)
MSSRRAFIKSGAIAMFGIGLGGVPAFVSRAAASFKNFGQYKKNKILICIFQRGAMDGLMAVSPFTDAYLKAARPSIFMQTKGEKNESLINLDERFGLHPSMAAFGQLFKEQQLAIIHGIGSPNNSRSHFDAQDYMETATPFHKGTPSGWLNRASGLLGHDASAFRAVSLTSSMPRSFYGDQPTLTINNLTDFAIRNKSGRPTINTTAQSFEELYDQAANQLLKSTSKETFDAVDMLSKVDVKNYKPTNGAVYPNTNLGNALKQLTQLIKADVGLEIGFAESTGWDTHYNQGTAKGSFAKSANDLAESISAMWKDLGGDLQDRVVIMTMTEFGRTVKQNGTGGTDHGRASCSFVIGNHLNGGKVHGNIQPLAVENLDEGRDLMVTTDFRALFSEVASKHMLINNQHILFPDYDGVVTSVFR